MGSLSRLSYQDNLLVLKRWQANVVDLQQQVDYIDFPEREIPLSLREKADLKVLKEQIAYWNALIAANG